MHTSLKIGKSRKKVNFMINTYILTQLDQLVKPGERSNFINETLEEKLKDMARKKAIDAMEDFRNTLRIRMSTAEIIRAKNYGRK